MKRFTFRENHRNSIIQRRLDFFCFQCFVRTTHKADLLASFCSEHSALDMIKEYQSAKRLRKFRNCLYYSIKKVVHKMSNYMKTATLFLSKENV